MNAGGHCHCEDRRTVLSTELLRKKQSEMKRTVPLVLRAEVLHISVLPEGLTVEPAVSCDCSVVIMNETFSDLNLVNTTKTNYEVMPFIHSLIENTIKGYMLVSVLCTNDIDPDIGTDSHFVVGRKR